MKYRKLRIAWSVGLGLLAVLLCVLWVRSYWWAEQLFVPISDTRTIAIGSIQGGVSISPFLPTVSGYFDGAVSSPRERFQSERFGESKYGFWDAAEKFRAERVRLGVRNHRTHFTIILPYFVLAGIAGLLATAPWLRWRFSLRTLLIATTLVAVGLGLIVWMA